MDKQKKKHVVPISGVFANETRTAFTTASDYETPPSNLHKGARMTGKVGGAAVAQIVGYFEWSFVFGYFNRRPAPRQGVGERPRAREGRPGEGTGVKKEAYRQFPPFRG
ncbi:hypothetical protein GWI33_001027 [Rhynchophorus ferrugineus]|uniref:Uncharacterized protein n=1 Tax=Rhynchophorus ferrugineus TaxID=354439 RepID=A0A834IZF9_RHYFE|nr:hypothetical protein GWI33_001027 [Rhynchophorus ferrugineus]